MLRPLGCKLLRWNMRCCSSSLHVIVTLEEAQDGHVAKGVGGGIEMVGNWNLLLIIMYRAQMLRKSVTESALGLTDVEETTSGATDTVDQV
eukprot:g40501.t1